MATSTAHLKDLLAFSRDGEWGSDSPSDDLQQMKVIRGTDFEDVRYGDLTSVPVRHIKHDAGIRKALKPDDIIIETAGGSKGQPTGRTVLVKERLLRASPIPATCSSFARLLRVERSIAEPAYVFWYLQHLYASGQMEQHQVQHTGVARFQYTRFAEAVDIPLPSLADQRVIADILGSLDDKIELNRKMNETLEAMARAVFKSWFVDFDPVVAKSEGRQPEGMDAETAKLFPSSFVDSEIGRVPKGWQVRIASDLAVVGIGKTPPRKEHQWFSTTIADIPWMSIRDLGDIHVFIAHTSEFLTPAAVDRFRVRRIPDGTVVLSFKLTIGRVAITDGEMLSNEAIAHFLLKPSTPFGSAYLYCYLKGFGYDQLGSTSSIATAINSEMVRQIRVLVPPRSIAAAFEAVVNPLFSQVKELVRQSSSLTSVRDSLLPGLLSERLSIIPPSEADGTCRGAVQ